MNDRPFHPQQRLGLTRPAAEVGGGGDADGGQRAGGGRRHPRLRDPQRFHGEGEGDHAERGLRPAAWCGGEPCRQAVTGDEFGVLEVGFANREGGRRRSRRAPGGGFGGE